MPLTSKSRSAYAEILFGQATDRAAALLPASTTASIFTVAGGRIALLGLLGEVVVVLAATANATKVVSVPTVGTAVDLCAALDLISKEAGALLSITGVFADALIGGTAGAGTLCVRPVVIPVGAIRLTTAGTQATGTVKWRAFWLPLDVGATVTAA